MTKIDGDLTFERCAEMLEYNPETGSFLWKATRGKARVGGGAGNLSMIGGQLRWQIGLYGRRYSASRIAWLMFYGKWPQHHIDHIDGNPRNNRIVNLRDVPHHVNMQNLKKARIDSGCGLLGVGRKRAKWRARIKVNGTELSLGCFDSPQEAHSVYIEAKRRLHEGCTI